MNTKTLLQKTRRLRVAAYTIFPTLRLACLAMATSSFLLQPAQAGLFRATGAMKTVRDFHTATLLANGKVLVVGGYNTNIVGTAELYDPLTGAWELTGALHTARDSHTATFLPDGQVLIVGGSGLDSMPIASAELYDPVTGTWSETGSLHVARAGHSATLLPNGQVLVAGGDGYSGTTEVSLDVAELYDPATKTWRISGRMHSARWGHTATLLGNGRVLVAAGYNLDAEYLNLAELYDPAAGAWAPTGALSEYRRAHTATLLPNGLVLVAGGFTWGAGFYDDHAPALSSAELYDPQTGTWRPTRNLNTARGAHTANLLPSSRVLISAGLSTIDTGFGLMAFTTSKAEEYDPATDGWSTTGELADSRENQTSTSLPDGRVLVAGGDDWSARLASAELYDSLAGGNWNSAGSLIIPRTYHTTTLLTNGQVLVAGGWYNGTNLSAAERYDPVTGNWISSGQMNEQRDNHTATLLKDGRVLVTGFASSELYDPASGAWNPTGWLNVPRVNHTATLLQNGEVLAAGGYDGFDLPDAELYDPITGDWSLTGSLNTPRNSHTATLLTNGQVLVAGGLYFDPDRIPLADVELYDPSSRTWTAAHSMTAARWGHTATLLPNGKVLVAGGQLYSNYLASAELYDPVTGAWALTGSMAIERSRHIAILLTNGSVLVAGGVNAYANPERAELYNPASGLWFPAPPMIIGRADLQAALLLDGRVLAVGGQNFDPWSPRGPVGTTELYDPGDGSGPPVQPSMVTNARVLADGGLRLVFTNTPGAHFSVLATTLPTLPSGEWMVLGGVSETAPGQFQFTDIQATNFPQRYYRVRSP